MANWDNQHTKQVQSEMADSFEAGINAGVDFVGYPLPEFCNKPVKNLLIYERGFLLGWWLNRWLKEIE